MKTYTHKNTTTQIVAVFDKNNNRIELGPGQTCELSWKREGQGIIIIKDEKEEQVKEPMKSKNKKQKESLGGD